MIESVVVRVGRDEQPREVVGGSATQASPQCRTPVTRVALDQDAVAGEVAVDDGRAEPPQRDVLEPVLPAPEQRGRHLSGAGRLVDLGLATPAVLAGVVGGQAGVLDEAGRQLVHGGDRAPEVGCEAGSGREPVEPQGLAGDLGVHGRAPALGQVREPDGRRDREREPPALGLGREHAEQDDLGLERGAGCGVLWSADDPPVAVGVDHDRGVEVGAGLRGTPDVEGVESRHGDGRQRGESERGSNHRVQDKRAAERSRATRAACLRPVPPVARDSARGPHARGAAAYGDRRDRSG